MRLADRPLPPPLLLRDESGAVTIQWAAVAALLAAAAVLAYPDLGYDLGRALERSGWDFNRSWP